ncbi:sugar kinase [Paracoccus pacificus]|uniref:Sugar kinase n=1 Tax=Paracoccus pacificus TaxID=1463598 RepID=A0ABW4R2N4_9RHOB
MTDFLSVGECMVELSGAGDGLWRQAFAGDTFNTAWYVRACAPSDRSVGYLTSVGRDAISDAMVSFMDSAGVDTRWISRHPTRAPGLYMIDLKDGERSFTYWRDASAARTLADDPDHLARSFAQARMIYFSGITLAILTPERRQVLLDAMKASPAQVAFDPNLRPRLWASGDEMRDWIMRGAAVSDIALPSHDDEAAHFGDADVEATARRYADAGVTEVVVKNGGGPMLAMAGGVPQPLPGGSRQTPVDTTGAGDSYNGGYLAARLAGADMTRAARCGHEMALQVIATRGALLPMDRIRNPYTGE